MPRTRSLAWAELKLGLIGIVAMVLVTVLVVAVGGEGGFFWERYSLKAKFRDVRGLKSGAVVRLSGKDVGKVTGIEFVGGDLDVIVEVSKEVRPLITTESVASIGAVSLLGEGIIEVRASASGTPLPDWAYLKTSESGGPIDDLTAKATASLDQAGQLFADIRAGKGSAGKFFTDEALYNELRAFATSAARVASALEKGEGTLGQLTKDPAAYEALKASLENLRAVTERLNSGQGTLGRLLHDDATGKSLAAMTANLEQVTERLKAGEGTMGRLLTDRALYDRFSSVATRMDQVVAGLESGKGTAGQLLHDRALYENMNRAVTELRDLLADIRKDPKKYLRVSVSIF